MGAPENAALVGRELAVASDIAAVYPDFVREMKVGYEKGKGFVSEIFWNRKDHHEPDIFLTGFYDFLYVADSVRAEFMEAA